MSGKKKGANSITGTGSIGEIIRACIYALCTLGIVLCLNAGCNAVYQTFKSRYAYLAFVFFMVMLWTMQRIRLFNWQSLAVTVPFLVYEIFYVSDFISSTEYYPSLIFAGIAVWMALMLIVDMLVTGRYRRMSKSNRWLFASFAVVVIALLVNRSGRTVPIAYCAVFLLYMIDIGKEEWEIVLRGVLFGLFLSMIAVTVLSFALNPLSRRAYVDDGSGFDAAGRWYGYFLNIGDFGQFLGLMLVVAVFALFLSKKNYGRKSVWYIVSMLWIVLTLVLAALNATRTFTAGLIFTVLVYFIFGVKKNNARKMIIKGSVIFGVIVVFLIAGYFVLHKISTMNIEPDDIEVMMGQAPFKYMSGFRVILDRIYKVKTGFSADPDHISSDRALGVLDALSSYRISIISKFLENTGWTGQEAPGFQVGDYFAYVAHNQYVQMVYEYGYLTGIAYIALVIAMQIVSIVRYIKSGRKFMYLLPMLLIAMTLGIWTGEGSTLFFPLTFFMFFFAHGLMQDAGADAAATSKKQSEVKQSKVK